MFVIIKTVGLRKLTQNSFKNLNRNVQNNYSSLQRLIFNRNNNINNYLHINKYIKRKTFNYIGNDNSLMSISDLWKPFIFVTGLTCCTYGVAAICEYENSRKAMKTRIKSMFDYRQIKRNENNNQINVWWNNLKRIERLFYTLLFLNASVYCLWKIPSLNASLYRNFTSNIYKKKMYAPTLFSMFSHNSLIHLSMNMYVLYTFISPLSYRYQPEEFLALYLGSGLFSSFLSQAVKILQGCSSPSLGASGAILGIIAATCLTYPDSNIGIVFLPSSISFTAQNALTGIIVFDTLGVILRWKFFDHAAHLGGALFGLWYVNYGHKYLWDKRFSLTQKWHEFRSKK